MTRAEKWKQYNLRLKKIKTEVRSISKRDDSIEKFEKLLKLSRDYKKIILEMQLDRFKIEVSQKYLSEETWQEKYNDFLKGTHKNKKHEPQKEDNIFSWNIILCWTIKHDYCICDSIIDNIKNYLNLIGLTYIDITKTEFPDRTEFCEQYSIKCSTDNYNIIMKSVDYILNISSNSIHDKCNIGVFGKKLEK